jgi:hypothetical protein
MQEVVLEREEAGNVITFSKTREPSFFPGSDIVRRLAESSEASVVLGRYRLIEELERHYTFENREDIYAFLLSVTDSVMDVLNEAPNHITKLFENVPLHLEVIHDPEEDFELLFIEIKTDLPAGSAVDLLDMLDDGWWLDVDTGVRKMLAIDV